MRVVAAGLIGLMLIVGFGCSDKSQAPSGVIPREEMEKILWDMMQADQYVTGYILKDTLRISARDSVHMKAAVKTKDQGKPVHPVEPGDPAGMKDSVMVKDSILVKDTVRVDVKMEVLKLYQEVFRLHDVTRDEFRKSLAYYKDRPDITRSMFDSLLARGNRLRAESYSRPAGATPGPSVPPPGQGSKPPPPGSLFPHPPPGGPYNGGRGPLKPGMHGNLPPGGNPKYKPGRDTGRVIKPYLRSPAPRNQPEP